MNSPRTSVVSSVIAVTFVTHISIHERLCYWKLRSQARPYWLWTFILRKAIRSTLYTLLSSIRYFCHCKTVCSERSDMGVGPSVPCSGGHKSHARPEFPAFQGLIFVLYLSHPVKCPRIVGHDPIIFSFEDSSFLKSWVV
jgi:hypothetical protein